MDDDAKAEFRAMIQSVSDSVRAMNPKSESAEMWSNPGLWLGLEGKDFDDDVWMTMFVAGMLARNIEIETSGESQAGGTVSAMKRRLIGNEVPEGTIPPEKRSPPMTANEVAEAHGVFNHSNPSKWLKDAYLQFERLGKKFVVDKTRFQSHMQG